MRLFDPVSIGKTEIHNRIVMPPMTTRFADMEGSVTEQSIHYYVTRARGGVGLVMVEMSGVDVAGRHRDRELGIYHDNFIPGLRRLVKKVKATGAKIGIQLAHGGGQALTRVTGLESVAPTSMPYVVHEKFTETHSPKELSSREIRFIINRFVEAAERAKRSGFDIIEVHGANGYLIYQFLSPLTNKRRDEYGGDTERRARIAIEIVRAIKDSISGLPVIFRISAEEYAEGGLTIKESTLICALLEKAGVDAIHVSAGSYLSTFPYMIPPMMLPPGCFLKFSEALKQSVRVPIIVAGRLHYPLLAEKAVEEGKTDMVALGRQLIADPEWPRKVSDGRFDEVRRCISCNYCVDAMRDGACLECAKNANAGSEWIRKSE